MSLASCAAAAVAVFPSQTVTTTAGPLPLRVVMVAIAGAESTWRDTAAGDTPNQLRAAGYGATAAAEQPYACPPGDPNGTTSWGLWQINVVHRSYLESASGASTPCGWAQWLYIPVNCATAALSVYQSSGLGAWSTYADGRWAANIAAATSAVAAAEQSTAGGGGGAASGGGQTAGGDGSTPGSAKPRIALNLAVWGGLAAVLLGGGAILDGLRHPKA